MLGGLLSIVFFLINMSSASPGTEHLIHVVPNEVSKSNNHPDKMTLHDAFQVIRNINSSEKNSSVVLEFQDGVYRLAETLRIDNNLLKVSNVSLILRAAPGANPHLIGSRSIGTPLTLSPQSLVTQIPNESRTHVRYFDLPAVGIKDFGTEKARGHTIFEQPSGIEFSFGEHPLHMARWPNVGYANLVEPAEPPQNKEDRLSVFWLKDAPLELVASKSDLWASGFMAYEWRYERFPILAIEPSTGKIKIARTQHDNYSLRAGQRVALENSLAFIDQPGEWYLDHETGILAVWPFENSSETPIEATMLETGLEIQGVSNVRVEGIDFSNFRGVGIIIRDSTKISVEDCRVANTGTIGISIQGGKDVHVERTVIRETGYEAIMAEGGNRNTLDPSRHVIRDNIIERFYRLHRGRIAGVTIKGVGNIVEGNFIHQGPYQAIWFSGNDHVIRRNEISEVSHECGDCGVIYTGRDWSARGSIIEENYIHDTVPAAGLEVKGIYLDDLASGITIRRNLILGVMKGLLIGGGRDNLIEDNLIIGARVYGILIDGRGMGWSRRQVDDPSSEIRRNLAAVPYRSPTYASRYPHLANLLEDEPWVPKYNVISNMIYVRGRGTVTEEMLSARQDIEPGLLDPGGRADAPLSPGSSELAASDVQLAISKLAIPIDLMRASLRLRTLKFAGSKAN